LSDSVVNSHEVGVLRELGDDFSHAYPLSLICYRRNRHEALFGGSVHLVGDLIEASTVTPSFKGKTECIDHVCARTKLHTCLNIANTKINATRIKSYYKP
jgi:hypothetical protein